MFSPSVVGHIVGLVALYHLIFSGQYHETLYSHLDKNATHVLRDTLESLLSTASHLLPSGLAVTDTGTALRMVLYTVAALYVYYLLRKLYKSVFGKMTMICPVVDIGFDFPEKEMSCGLISKQDVVNEVRRRKRIGEIPPPYPNGWFALIRSDELKPGESTSMNALGENFAVFRDESGTAHVLDAYCTHLGANLGVAGKVLGKCIECPFHGWQFDGETGKCSKIPYSKGKIPEQAHNKAWPTVEFNGHILVWYDAEGRDPLWSTDKPEIFKRKSLENRGYSTHYVNAHIEDIPENGADVAHLNALHGAGISSGSETNYRDILSGKLHTHSWQAKWEAMPEPTAHIGRMTLSMVNTILGMKVEAFNVTTVAEQIGPAVVYLTLDLFFGRVILVQTLLPLEALLQKYMIVVYSDWWIPTFFLKWIVRGYDIQLERDMIVWNNKRYRTKPVLVREDELILKHRRWYSQFYSENSKRITFQKDNLSF